MQEYALWSSESPHLPKKGYRKNKATFHAAPPARVRPPPAPPPPPEVAPSSPARRGGRLAQRGGKIKPLFTPPHSPASAHPLPPCATARGRPQLTSAQGRPPGATRRKNKATFHAAPLARVRPPPAPPAPPPEVAPSSPARRGGRLAPPALAARRWRLARRGLGAGQRGRAAWGAIAAPVTASTTARESVRMTLKSFILGCSYQP